MLHPRQPAFLTQVKEIKIQDWRFCLENVLFCFILNLGSAGDSEFVGLDCKQHQVSQLALWLPMASLVLVLVQCKHAAFVPKR